LSEYAVRVSAYIQKNCDENYEPARKGVIPAREVGLVRGRVNDVGAYKKPPPR